MGVGRMRRVVAGAVVAAGVAASMLGPGHALAATNCPAITTRTMLPAPTPTGWSENLAYDKQGDLWVSRVLDDVVDRYDSAGRRIASVRVDAPGSVRLGPDGLMYVASGDSPLNMVPGSPATGEVLRFDPVASQPVAHVFATGLGMPNGMAFDHDGRLYVADSKLGVLRLDRRGIVDDAWSRSAPKNLAPTSTVDGTGVNGIVVVGDDLYVTLTTSLTGRILRVPINRPQNVSVASDVTAPLPGVLDDLVALDSHTLVTALTTGQIATVDLRTSQVCRAGVGQPVTSLAIRPDAPGELVSGTESGALLRITLRR